MKLIRGSKSETDCDGVGEDVRENEKTAMKPDGVERENNMQRSQQRVHRKKRRKTNRKRKIERKRERKNRVVIV